MNSSQMLLLVMAGQLGLYTIGWVGAAIYVRDARLVIGYLYSHTLLTGLCLALEAMRGRWPDILCYPISDVLAVIGLTMYWRGINAFTSVRVSRWLLDGLPALACVLILWFYFIEPNGTARTEVMFLAVGLTAIFAVALNFQSVRREFGNLMAALLICAGIWLCLILVWRAVLALASGGTIPLDLDKSVDVWTVIALLASGSFAYYLLGYGIVGRLVERLDYLSTHDALTGLLNRRAVLDSLEDEWQRFRRYESTFVLLAIDIDHFKHINDQYGHAIGDQVLIRIAELFSRILRRTDIVGRTGGEEFVVILRNIDAGNGLRLAEHFRLAVAQHTWPDTLRAQGEVTTSIGLAFASRVDQSSTDLFARADAALYRAKAAGRNCVIHDESTVAPMLNEGSDLVSVR